MCSLLGAQRRALLCGCLLVALGCEASVERRVQYDERFERNQMDLYLPGDDAVGRPAILTVHGGAWTYFDNRSYRSIARRFARSGYVVGNINYRLVPDGVFPNSVHDVACALAYLQNHADELGLDPARIAVMGYSAGAHLATLVAVEPGDPLLVPDCAEGAPMRPAAVVSGAGPTDMRGLRDADLVRRFMGGREEDIPELYALASPVEHASPDDPPTLFVHGRWDLFVPVDQSRTMRDLLRAEGVEANLLELSGTGHVFNPNDDASSLGIALSNDSPEAWAVILDFLDRHIGQP
jgi:acetyl esterase/lipase